MKSFCSPSSLFFIDLSLISFNMSTLAGVVRRAYARFFEKRFVRGPEWIEFGNGPSF
jgi:hypothetical protein